jgi:porphobilinogen synthase
VRAVLLFGIPRAKDEIGSGAWDDSGPVPRAIAELKRLDPDLLVIVDVCLCEYTSHGHCGVVRDESGVVLNDETLPLLGQAAVCYALAGADIVAPSAMMDGQVAAIRIALD